MTVSGSFGSIKPRKNHLQESSWFRVNCEPSLRRKMQSILGDFSIIKGDVHRGRRFALSRPTVCKPAICKPLLPQAQSFTSRDVAGGLASLRRVSPRPALAFGICSPTVQAGNSKVRLGTPMCTLAWAGPAAEAACTSVTMRYYNEV